MSPPSDPPFPLNSTILFQGDSITDAFRKPKETNNAYQLGNGYVFLIASRLAAAYPATGFRFINRGVSGNRLSDINDRWQRDALDLQPDILSVLAGVNDTLFAPGNIELFEEQYTEILHRTRSALPKTRIILIEPFLLSCGTITENQCRDMAKKQDVVQRLCLAFGATFLPVQNLFNAATQLAPAEYWAYDGIHPTEAGHWLLAENWLKIARSHPQNDLAQGRRLPV